MHPMNRLRTTSVALLACLLLADGGFQFMQDLAAQNRGSFKEIKPGMTSFGF